MLSQMKDLFTDKEVGQIECTQIQKNSFGSIDRNMLSCKHVLPKGPCWIWVWDGCFISRDESNPISL